MIGKSGMRVWTTIMVLCLLEMLIYPELVKAQQMPTLKPVIAGQTQSVDGGTEAKQATGFLGLAAGNGPSDSLWEGRTDYGMYLRPHGTIRAVMLFAKFPDTTTEETTTELYDRLVPGGIAFFDRASYGKMTLQVDAVHRWIPMDHPSTWPDYNCSEWQTQKTYLAEAISKAAKDVDFKGYDIVYLCGSKSPGKPNSPTFIAAKGQGIIVGGAEIRHAVTFGNDTRLPDWAWQTLAHETGHMCGLPDLYSFDDLAGPYKNIQKYVGFWDLMGFQAPGSEYLAWHKRKFEWLADTDFEVVPSSAIRAKSGTKNGSKEVLITPIDEKGGLKAVAAPISKTEAYVAEVRSRDGKPGSETGVLLYKVSLTATTGHGPIRVIPARPDDGDKTLEKRYITLYNALFQEGVVLDDPSQHIHIEILGHVGRAYRLRIGYNLLSR